VSSITSLTTVARSAAHCSAVIGSQDGDLSANQQEKVAAHHDAVEFPDGQIVLLTVLREGQQAPVLQLPAEPKTAIESAAQQRAAYVG
jgi:hypothetical protein